MALVKIFILTLFVYFSTLENVAGNNYNPAEFYGKWYVTHVLSATGQPLRPAVPACMTIDVTEGQSTTYNILMSANMESRIITFSLTANLNQTALDVFSTRGLINPGSYDIIDHNNDEIVVRNIRAQPHVILSRQSDGGSRDLYMKYKRIAYRNQWVDNIVDQINC